MNLKPPRFSLRTLFVLVTVASVLACWVLYNLNWIAARRAHFIGRGNSAVYYPATSPTAPWPLGLFGETGFQEVSLGVENDEASVLVWTIWPDEMTDLDQDKYLTDAHRTRLAELAKLFPEAKIRANFFPTLPRF